MTIFSHDLGQLLPQAREWLDRPAAHFIGGQRELLGKHCHRSILPLASRSPRSLAGDSATVDAAVRAATAALASEAWGGAGPQTRERVILRLAELIEANAAALAQIEQSTTECPLGSRLVRQSLEPPTFIVIMQAGRPRSAGETLVVEAPLGFWPSSVQ